MDLRHACVPRARGHSDHAVALTANFPWGRGASSGIAPQRRIAKIPAERGVCLKVATEPILVSLDLSVARRRRFLDFTVVRLLGANEAGNKHFDRHHHGGRFLYSLACRALAFSVGVQGQLNHRELWHTARLLNPFSASTHLGPQSKLRFFDRCPMRIS